MPYDPAILGIYPKKTIIQKDSCTPVFTIYNNQDIETHKWMNKEDVVHIYNGICFSRKKEQNNATWNNMDGPRDYHTEWSKSEKEIP